jgi:hypothetical protein
MWPDEYHSKWSLLENESSIRLVHTQIENAVRYRGIRQAHSGKGGTQNGRLEGGTFPPLYLRFL